MEILLTTVTAGIDSEIDPRFGRAAHFLIVDPDTMVWRAEPNPALSAPGGAGVQAAQFAVDQKCSAVISGDFGPNAFEALYAAGIAMYQYGSCRTAREAIDLFKDGQLPQTSAPTPGRRKRHSRHH